MTPLIEVRDLDVALPHRHDEVHEAVRGVSFDIPANTTVALVGRVGQRQERERDEHRAAAAGQRRSSAPTATSSTRAATCCRRRRGQMRRLRGKDISVVFQEPMSSLNPVFTVGEQIAEVLRMHMPACARARRASARWSC